MRKVLSFSWNRISIDNKSLLFFRDDGWIVKTPIAGSQILLAVPLIVGGLILVELLLGLRFDIAL